MAEAFICDAVRTPIGRYAGALANVRTDDLAASPIKALMARNPQVDWAQARRGLFSAAPTRPARTTAMSRAWRCCWRACRTTCRASTLNRLCASGLDAVGAAARAISAGEIDLAIAGGVEFDVAGALRDGQGDEAFPRAAEIHDTTIGWRFVNPLMKQHYGIDSMPETGENVAEEFQVSRADQDAFALRSQQRAGKAHGGRLLRRRDRRRSTCRTARAARSRRAPTSIRGPRRRSKASPS